MPEAIASRVLRLPGYEVYAYEADETTSRLELRIRRSGATLYYVCKGCGISVRDVHSWRTDAVTGAVRLHVFGDTYFYKPDGTFDHAVRIGQCSNRQPDTCLPWTGSFNLPFTIPVPYDSFGVPASQRQWHRQGTDGPHTGRHLTARSSTGLRARARRLLPPFWTPPQRSRRPGDEVSSPTLAPPPPPGTSAGQLPAPVHAKSEIRELQ
jgi:hypothetical protein